MSLKPRTVDFNATWGNIRDTIKGVITIDHVPRTIWNDRFSDVYSLCVAHPEPMADRLYAETKQYLIDHVARLLEQVQEGGESQLVTNYYKFWSQYSIGSQYLHSLYLYLNQQHIRSKKLTDAEVIYGNGEFTSGEQMEIGELALEVWQSGMIAPLGQRLVRLLLDDIERDRRGQSTEISISAVSGTILSFVNVQGYKRKCQLQLYQELFEEPFLNESGEFFKCEAIRLLDDRSVSLYMQRVKVKIAEELKRARKFLHPSSLPKVTQRCETHMVAEHLEFLYSECTDMVRNERRTDLANMYDLLKSIPDGINTLVDTVLEHIKSQGLTALMTLEGDQVHVTFVESMLAVHRRYRELIADVFRGDQVFMGALDRACSHVINYRPSGSTTTNSPALASKLMSRSPELLAKYCDTLLRKSLKGYSDSDVDERLTESITVFKYIDDKDVFQKFYARMLAKRLIHQLSHSMDAEEAMINRLKQACGYEFTSKLHRMFTDMSVSADLNNKFQEHLKNDSHDLGINFSIYVLQAGAWPLSHSHSTPFTYPQQLERSVQMFERFYHVRFNGRKLTWLHNLCQAELRLNHLRKPYLVTMQTFQMATMLLFENTNALTYKEILDSLQLSSEQYYRYAISLIDCKFLLCEQPSTTHYQQDTNVDSCSSSSSSCSNSNELKPNTILRLNLDYSNKRTKFKINAAITKESPQEVEQTITSVEEDRKMYLQAAIVRIMKARKILKHNALIQEVYKQSKVNFTPSIQLIKKCVESLIDKQYIERTANSSDEYSYVA